MLRTVCDARRHQCLPGLAFVFVCAEPLANISVFFEEASFTKRQVRSAHAAETAFLCCILSGVHIRRRPCVPRGSAGPVSRYASPSRSVPQPPGAVLRSLCVSFASPSPSRSVAVGWLPGRTACCEKRIAVAQAASLPFPGNCVSRCASPSRPWSSPRIARRGTPRKQPYINICI